MVLGDREAVVIKGRDNPIPVHAPDTVEQNFAKVAPAVCRVVFGTLRLKQPARAVVVPLRSAHPLRILEAERDASFGAGAAGKLSGSRSQHSIDQRMQFDGALFVVFQEPATAVGYPQCTYVTSLL